MSNIDVDAERVRPCVYHTRKPIASVGLIILTTDGAGAIAITNWPSATACPTLQGMGGVLLALRSRRYPVRLTNMATKQTPAGHKAQRAARKPSQGTVVQAAPAQATTPVQVTPATALASMAATLANVAQPQPSPAPVVALRGGLAIANVALTGKPYRVGCAHNTAWWQQCQQAVQAGGGTASVAALVQAGVPGIFVGYVVRRGYLQPAQVPHLAQPA